MATYKGTTGNDTITGTANDDSFAVEQGGEDTVSGLGGNDIFHFVAQFDAGDSIDGGAGSDTLLLRGDYSDGVVFTDTTMVNVEKIELGAGYNYKLTTADATVAAGASLFVDAAPLGAGNTLTFDGSHETNGTFIIEDGAGNDVLTGGAGNDVFRLKGGEDTLQGGGGDDVFVFGNALDAGDSVDGGTGRNTIRLNANYASLTLGANTIKNIQNVQFDPCHNYNITTNDGNFVPGTTIDINGNALAAGNTLTFDAAAESSASFKFYGGAGNDVLTGGNGGSVFELTKGGNDCATGGTGRDIFNIGATLTSADRINGGGGADTLDLDGNYATKLTFGATTMTGIGT
jgi:Ca2+-binding RTX toxin-like protein